MGDTLWTIGHSTRAWDVFVAMLHDAGIAALVDVRRFAGSRRHPQFSGATMGAALREAGVDYVPMPDLGGRRTARKDSPNTTWRNASFRGYADYMETEQFQKGVERLLAFATSDPESIRGRNERGGGEAVTPCAIAIMCAEAVWWRCHRSLIADYLKARGVEVLHILGANKVEPHPYTSVARIVNGELSYRPESLL